MTTRMCFRVEIWRNKSQKDSKCDEFVFKDTIGEVITTLIKNNNNNCLVFQRLGNEFYPIFGQDKNKKFNLKSKYFLLINNEKEMKNLTFSIFSTSLYRVFHFKNFGELFGFWKTKDQILNISDFRLLQSVGGQIYPIWGTFNSYDNDSANTILMSLEPLS